MNRTEKNRKLYFGKKRSTVTERVRKFYEGKTQTNKEVPLPEVEEIYRIVDHQSRSSN